MSPPATLAARPWPAPRLLVGLALRRHGLLPPAALALLLVGALAWAWLLPRHAAVARTAQRLAAVAAPVARSASAPASAQATLRDALVSPESVNDTVRAVLAQAQAQGVAIGKVEYRWGADSASRSPTRVQLGLPLRGDYPAIKQFLATVMLGLPGASIDQLSLTRSTEASNTPTGSSALDGMVWLSLWQRSLLAPRNADSSADGDGDGASDDNEAAS